MCYLFPLSGSVVAHTHCKFDIVLHAHNYNFIEGVHLLRHVTVCQHEQQDVAWFNVSTLDTTSMRIWSVHDPAFKVASRATMRA